MKDMLTKLFIVVLALLLAPLPSYSQESLGEATCEVGLQKCAPVRNNVVGYWACMEETCTKQVDESPSCAEGHQECSPKLDEYRLCVNIICKNETNIFAECDAGKNACTPSLRKYWDCVTETCLGDVEKYKEMEEEEYQQPDLSFSNKEITEETGEVENDVISSTPMEELYCEDDSASITCFSKYIKSCKCSDGSIPKIK